MTVIAGSFSSAMVPTYIRVMQQEGKAEAQALLSRVMVLGVVLLCGATAIAAVVVPYFLPVLAMGFSQAKVLLTRDLFFVLLPLIAVKGMATYTRRFCTLIGAFHWSLLRRYPCPCRP